MLQMDGRMVTGRAPMPLSTKTQSSFDISWLWWRAHEPISVRLNLFFGRRVKYKRFLFKKVYHLS